MTREKRIRWCLYCIHYESQRVWDIYTWVKPNKRICKAWLQKRLEKWWRDNWHKKRSEVYDMDCFIAYDIDIHLDRMLEQTDKILEELKKHRPQNNVTQ